MSALTDALSPVRDALLDRARRDAAATAERAGAEAAAVLAEADASAAAIAAEARAAGERDADVVRARESARAHRAAREEVLRAQQQALADLHDRARAAVAALRTDPAYPALLARLHEQALAELGPGAAVREHPAGGLVATAPGRRLDLSLPALADRALADLGAEVTRLWAPVG